VNVENQIKIKICVNQFCKDVFSGPWTRLLSMTATNDHPHMRLH
jgi:hypothetical protein